MDFTTADYREAITRLGIEGPRGWKKSDSWMFYCPLGHSKKRSPSMKVDFRQGIWYCHSCHEGGHLSKLVTLMRRSESTLAQLLGKEADMVNLTSQAAQVAPQVVYTIPEVDVRGVLVPWSESKEAMEYLDYRGILPMIATRANIKFLKDGYANGTELVNRLMIPVYDEHHRAINWEARDVTFQAKLKCLYPKGATKPLYEWYKLDKTKPVFLFEGLIKTLVARSDPYFANSTTTFGSGVNALQLEQLNQFDHLISVPDKDPPPFFDEKLKRIVVPSAAHDQIQYLQENWKGARHEIYELNHPDIKDTDEIPTKLNMTVKDFRMAGGFIFRGTL